MPERQIISCAIDTRMTARSNREWAKLAGGCPLDSTVMAVTALEMNQQQGNSRRGQARNPSRLTEGAGQMADQFFAHFPGQAMNSGIIQISRQGQFFMAALALNLFLLPVNVAGIFDLNFDLLGDLWIGCARTSAGQTHQVGITHFGPAQ